MKFLFTFLTPVVSILAAPLVMPEPSAPGRAFWLWNSSIIAEDTATSKFISVATEKNHKINRVYALVNRHIDDHLWSGFIQKCTSAGIAVEALMGDAQWVLATASPDCDTLQQQLDWVYRYQIAAAPGAKFSGLHMDVEPWGLPDWESNTMALVSSLLEVTSNIIAVGRSLDMPTAADIPFWAYTVKCEDTTLDRCFIRYVDSVTLMTYRNSPTELIEIATPALQSIGEVNEAGKAVWLAVETCPKVPEASLISYAGKSVATLMNDLSTVEKNLKLKFPHFGGIAIHTYQDFLALGG